MSSDNDRIAGDSAYCLVSHDRKHFVFFIEEADSVFIDLTGMPGRQPVMVVDAKAQYREIDMGHLSAGTHTIDLSASSDWAVAVGQFGHGPVLP